jgi:predicted dehydrogenase
MNRRSFLKITAATASVTHLSRRLDAADNSPSSSRLKIGFLGASHSHAFEKVKLAKDSPDFQLVGICDDSEDVRRRFGNLGVQFLSRAELLKQAEVVAVESAVRDHAEHAEAALLAGKHVHLEKPPADNLKAFEALVRLAQEKKLLLQMGYMWRFNPGINDALRAARQGWLGDIYLVRATINTTVPADRRPEWAEFRGGTMFELGSHVIDPVVRLLGRPEKVTTFLKKHGRFDDRLADNTVAVLEFPKAMSIVTSATLQPGAGAHRMFEILGTNGTALVKPIEQPTLQIDLAKAAGPYAAKNQIVTYPQYKRYIPEFAELAEAIRQKRPLAVTPQEDLLVQETLLRACEMI